MDQIDVEILRCLKRNARMRASAVADTVGLSVSAVTERIRKLEQSGVIRQYAVVIDQKVIGHDVTALMEVQLEHPSYYEAFVRMIEAKSSVASCHYLAGDYDFILKIITDSSEHLKHIHAEIQATPGVSNTKTYLVLRTPKDEVTVLPRI